MSHDAVQDFIDQVKDASEDMAAMSDAELFKLFGSANSYDFQRLTDSVAGMKEGPLKTGIQQTLARELAERGPLQLGEFAPVTHDVTKHSPLN